jgi:hypothetical protein
MTTIEFNVTKLNNHDHMIFGDYDHLSMTIVMKISKHMDTTIIVFYIC